MSAIVGEVTGEDVRRAQMRAWYSDPARKLPRKVVADVLWLLDEIAESAVERARSKALVEALTTIHALAALPGDRDNIADLARCALARDAALADAGARVGVLDDGMHEEFIIDEATGRRLRDGLTAFLDAPRQEPKP